jgi:hypothetical protein
MKPFLFLLVGLVAAISLASAAYTPQQQAEISGLRLSYQLGQAYDRIQLQGGDVSGFNALVDQWNAWVAVNFGQDSNLLMQKMATGAANLQRPFLYANNTTHANVVHQIDGAAKGTQADYTTNDMNLLPDSARNQTLGATYDKAGHFTGYANPTNADYLGGV